MNKDLFSVQAANYERYRPSYPMALYDVIAHQAVGHDCVWDCATGNGQAALDLAKYFDHVVATDLSEKQIQHARPHPNVRYRAASCEASGLPDRSVDCVTVAQALHWFADDAFYDEVCRVLKPGGLLATWMYTLPRFESELLTQGVDHFYEDILGQYWDPLRHHIDEAYAHIYWPFKAREEKVFKQRFHWCFEDLMGYFSSWSATQTYIRQEGEDPVQRFARPWFEKHWSDQSADEPGYFNMHLFWVKIPA